MKARPDGSNKMETVPLRSTKRISAIPSPRLQDRMTPSDLDKPEVPTPLKPPIPPKSSLRESASSSGPPPQSATSSTWPLNARPSETTLRPGYDWVPNPLFGDKGTRNSSAEGEKLAAFGRTGGFQPRRRSWGGWGRTCLIAGLVALVIIGLAVGLGVGLTVRRRNRNAGSEDEATTAPTTDNITETNSFPLGQYSMITALKTINTGCTSNPNTWTCAPNTTYNPQDSSSFNASMSDFLWIISNTSSIFAANGTATTSDAGVPANLTISATSNPLSIVFSDEPLTYFNPASNSSAERLSFSFTMAKSVIPEIDISGTDTQSRCYFNETTFTGTLYLSESRTYPDSSITVPDSEDTQWPYAIEITQTSHGGQIGDDIIPACYTFADGMNGDPLTAGLSAQPADSQCECAYNNF